MPLPLRRFVPYDQRLKTFNLALALKCCRNGETGRSTLNADLGESRSLLQWCINGYGTPWREESKSMITFQRFLIT